MMVVLRCFTLRRRHVLNAPPCKILHIQLFSTTSSSTSNTFPYHNPYKRAINNIFSSTEFKSKKKSYLGQKLWTEDMFVRYERWLLQKKCAVDTSARWDRLRKQWMEELTSSDATSDTKIQLKANSRDAKKKVSLELTDQAYELQSTIFDATDLHRGINRINDRLVAQAVSRMMSFVFQKLMEYCQHRNGEILPIVWFKIKESGVMIDTKHLDALTNAMNDESIQNLTNREQETPIDPAVLEEISIYMDLLDGQLSATRDDQRCSLLLAHHCEQGDIDAILSLLREERLRPSKTSPFTIDHYFMIMTMLIEKEYLRDYSGIKVFNEVTKDIKDGQTGTISQSSAEYLHNALYKEAKSLEGVTSELGALDSVRTKLAKANELLACRVMIDSYNNCSVTNTQLHKYSGITADQRRQLYDDILSLVERHSSLVMDIKTFCDWFRNRDGPPFTVVIDGANALRKSLSKVVAKMKAGGHQPLVIVPENIASKKLRCNGSVYVAPDGYDDLFCMITTVLEQKEPYEGSVVLVTNDQFLDHGKLMRDPSLVQSWYRKHVRSLSNDGELNSLPPTTIQMAAAKWDDIRLSSSLCSIATAAIKHTTNDNRQHLISFTQNQHLQLYDDIIELAQTKTRGLKEIKRFTNWLETRQGRPYTVIIDAANVGCVDTMVDMFVKSGECPLLIFPEELANNRSDLAQRLQKSGNIYVVPYGQHDDIFCMIATVSKQNKRPTSIYATQACPILISNDRYLDHRKQMRDRQLSHVWYQRHCYNHRGANVKDLPQKIFKRRIGCNDPTINADKDTVWEGPIWHFPVAGWKYHERFVFRMPYTTKEE